MKRGVQQTSNGQDCTKQIEKQIPSMVAKSKGKSSNAFIWTALFVLVVALHRRFPSMFQLEGVVLEKEREADTNGEDEKARGEHTSTEEHSEEVNRRGRTQRQWYPTISPAFDEDAGFDSAECEESTMLDKDPEPLWGCEVFEEIRANRKKYGLKFIGSGYYRDVYAGTYEGKEIVFKELKESQSRSSRNRRRHRLEARALEETADSENVVHLLGYCEFDIITLRYPITLDKVLWRDSRKPFSEGLVLQMALDAARGVAALHGIKGGPVIHADLQPRQFLLGDDGIVRINDINRGRAMRRTPDGEPCPFMISKANGIWRAPEEYALTRLTEKIDVYSLSLVFYAMMRRDRPWEKDSDDDYKVFSLKGMRPPTEISPDSSDSADSAMELEHMYPGLCSVMEWMWAQRPSSRPTAAEVVSALEEVIAEAATRDIELQLSINTGVRLAKGLAELNYSDHEEDS